jgi:hypothetical protein
MRSARTGVACVCRRISPTTIGACGWTPTTEASRAIGTGSFRAGTYTELPAGKVTAISLTSDADRVLVLEARLTVGGHDLLLVAGELYEGVTGGLTYAWGDESVLAFTDAGAADRVPWDPPRLQYQMTPASDDASPRA